MSNQATGDCLCGNYHYEFDRDQIISAHHCHCKDCQKMTGSVPRWLATHCSSLIASISGKP